VPISRRYRQSFMDLLAKLNIVTEYPGDLYSFYLRVRKYAVENVR